MREKDSFFCSTCHNSFARLPLNWSLSEMLMLRESGSLRPPPLPPPRAISPFPPSWVPRWLDNRRRADATECTHEGGGGLMSVRLELTANQIGSNSVTSQSDAPLNRYSMSARMK